MINFAASNTLDGILRRSASRHPDKIAIEFEGRRISYQELDQMVDQISIRLTRISSEAGARIAAFGGNSPEYLALLLACSRARLIHVPINNRLIDRDVAHIVDDSGAELLVTEAERMAELRLSLQNQNVTVMSFDDGPEGILKPTGAPAGIETLSTITALPSDVVQLLYTSGTTSAPKGAVMSHSALISEYVSAVLALDFSNDDRPLICMPLYHSAGMHVLTMPYLMLGATITLHRRPDIEKVLTAVHNDGINSLFLAPTVWIPLSNHPLLAAVDLSGLEKAQYGASIMPAPVLNRLMKSLPNAGFYNCFGQSEIGPLATVLGPEGHLSQPSSCGKPVLFVEARVVDDYDNDVAVGEPGEIVYRSPQLCFGYWNNPQETEKAFKNGWFHSGDLVTQDEDGYLTVVDRKSDVINTGGILVAPRDIEETLYLHSGVAEAAVVGKPDDHWIEAIVAYVVPKNGALVSSDELSEYLKGEIAPFKVPKQINIVESLPRNESGKILKRSLRQDRPSRG